MSPIISGAGGGGAAVPTMSVVGQPAGSTTSAVGSANMFMVRTWIPVTQTYTNYEFTIGVQNGNMMLGIYKVSDNSKVSAEASFAVPAAGTRQHAITGGALSLAAGEYWLALQLDGATASIGAEAGNVTTITGTALLANTFASGLPASVTGLTLGTTCIVLVLSH